MIKVKVITFKSYFSFLKFKIAFIKLLLVLLF